MAFDMDLFMASVMDDPLVRDTWRRKYRHTLPDGSSPEATVADTRRRVVEGVYAKDPDPHAKAEAMDLVQRGLLVPAGRVNAGAGLSKNVTLINCFVNETVQDSMPGIQRAIMRAALTMQQGGGIGTDWSTVRPAGAIVGRTGSVSSGVIPFMDQMSAMCKTIESSGSRRGAMMGTLRDDHPDLWNENQFDEMTTYSGDKVLKHPSFISAKRQRDRLTQFNISVLVSDAFIQAVENDLDWDLGFHVPRADGSHVDVYARPFTHDEWEEDNEIVSGAGEVWNRGIPVRSYRKGEMRPWYVYRRVKARRIWDDIMRSTYRFAEPGLVFIDRVNDRNNLNYCETIRCCNPCQPAFAPVLTPHGLSSIGNVCVGDTIWSENGWVTVVNKWATGVKPVYRYRTTAGVFYGTAEHRIVEGGVKVPVQDAEGIDVLTGPTSAVQEWNPQCIMDGLVIGDGSVHPTSTDKVYLTIGKDDQDYFKSEVSHLIKGDHAVKYGYAFKILTTITPDEMDLLPTRTIPTRYVIADTATISSFLRGLYSANGSVVTSGSVFRVTLKTTSSALVEQVQTMLSALGILSFFTTNKPSRITWLNGTYASKVSYDVNIAGKYGELFASVVGFVQDYKNEKLRRAIDGIKQITSRRKTCYEIRDTELLGEMEVFDITVSGDRHTYWSGGHNVSNCGEQMLPPHNVCCLSSINTAFMVRNPFTPQAEFDFDLLRETARVGVRFLDNVLDVSRYPLDAQRDEAHAKRRVGLGITGWGDALVQLGITYGTPESAAISREAAEHLMDSSYLASALLAKERGPFPMYDADQFLSGYNASKLPGYVRDVIRSNGIRNGVLNTIAPNGTISLYSGNVSSGHEPVFSFDKAVRKVRQDDGTLREYETVDYAYRLYEAIHGPTPREKLPAYFVGAMEIPVSGHINVHAAWQEFIDSSISKTINCAEEMPFDEFVDVYRTAYDLGCKGCTTYRPDPTSGRGSVLSVVEKPEAIASAMTQPDLESRPEVLPCMQYKLKWPITGKNWYIGITNRDGVPFEMFITAADASAQEWVTALSRTVTAVLRRGGDVRFLVDQLSEVYSSSGGAFIASQKQFRPSVVAAIAGVMEIEFRRLGLYGGTAGLAFHGTQEQASEYLKETLAAAVTTMVSAMACPVCSERTFVKESGCSRCLTCGHNSCG